MNRFDGGDSHPLCLPAALTQIGQDSKIKRADKVSA